MPRWTGKGRHSTEGYIWRHEKCPICGLRYRDFRIKEYFPDVGSSFGEIWTFCKNELRLERDKSEARGDYSKPVNRRSVLGRMFEYKQQGWARHIQICEEQQELIDAHP